jgi:uncharacterized protein (DUF1697 family)
LLRGINVVRTNRISMIRLRTALEKEGFRDVATYLQSGNVVLSSRMSADRVAERVERMINKEFGLDITVLVRSQAELARVVRRDPLAGIGTSPRRYLVTFLSEELTPATVAELRSVSKAEPFAVIGREIYSWHPEGIGRTPLWERLASRFIKTRYTGPHSMLGEGIADVSAIQSLRSFTQFSTNCAALVTRREGR